VFEPEAQHATPSAFKSIFGGLKSTFKIRQRPPTSVSDLSPVTDLRRREPLGLMVANPIKIGYSFDRKEKVDA